MSQSPANHAVNPLRSNQIEQEPGKPRLQSSTLQPKWARARRTTPSILYASTKLSKSPANHAVNPLRSNQIEQEPGKPRLQSSTLQPNWARARRTTPSILYASTKLSKSPANHAVNPLRFNQIEQEPGKPRRQSSTLQPNWARARRTTPSILYAPTKVSKSPANHAFNPLRSNQIEQEPGEPRRQSSTLQPNWARARRTTSSILYPLTKLSKSPANHAVNPLRSNQIEQEPGKPRRQSSTLQPNWARARQTTPSILYASTKLSKSPPNHAFNPLRSNQIEQEPGEPRRQSSTLQPNWARARRTTSSILYPLTKLSKSPANHAVNPLRFNQIEQEPAEPRRLSS